MVIVGEVEGVLQEARQNVRAAVREGLSTFKSTFGFKLSHVTTLRRAPEISLQLSCGPYTAQ